jgi:hypothetical protein
VRAGGRAVIVALLSLFALAAHADVYTWTDANGRVQYSDQPPKNFSGVVKRVEMDEKPSVPAALPQAKVKKEEPAAAAPPAAKDMATRRRDERERLGDQLAAAREKLAEARKALAQNQEPEAEERQIVLRPGAAPGALPMPGIISPATRSNCREQVSNDGKKSIFCPVSMPNDAYFERIAKLEAAVKSAEEEVTTAERAYRRGVD